VGAGLVGAASLFLGETDSSTYYFTYPDDAKRVAKKVSGIITEYATDVFIANAGTSAKQVYDSSGTLVWSPHNMFLNSDAPVTQNVTLVVGRTYTMIVVGSGSLAGTSGASGTASAGSPASFTASGTTGTFTKTGTLTRMQLNRGAVATAYIPTTAAARFGLAIDNNPSTLAPRGLLVEGASTNLLLNNETLSTQSPTVTAVAHTLSFWGTGTITLTGVSTAGPLVGTGVNDRVTLTFTPTAGALTCTVAGTVSKAQLEIGTIATSPIPTFGATATRSADQPTVLTSQIPWSDTESTIYCEDVPRVFTATYAWEVYVSASNRYRMAHETGVNNTLSNVNTTPDAGLNGGAAVANVLQKTTSGVKGNDFAISSNGAAVVTDATVVLTTGYTKLCFGHYGGGTNQLNGWIQKLVHVPRRVANADLPTWRYTP
jgi:hypothetical protein